MPKSTAANRPYTTFMVGIRLSSRTSTYPRGDAEPATVVLLHGGWWGPKYGADNLDGVAADLAERGWVAWNVEYRRLELGGGYPFTLEDVARRSITSPRSMT